MLFRPSARPTRRGIEIPTITGVLYALAAGLMWGGVFVSPLLLPDYPPAMQSMGRYLAFGLICLPLGWLDRNTLRRLTRSDWVAALKLAAIGNLLYYLCLSSAVQLAGAPLPTMIIGTLPVVIAIIANLRDTKRDGRLPWRLLAPGLLSIAAGIACVHYAELTTLHIDAASLAPYVRGVLLACGALVCWTWYPLHNADWLRAHSDFPPRTWATAQGIATLPLALAGHALVSLWLWHTHTFALPLGPRALYFVGLMASVGLFASWLGTLCWNAASQRLPPTLSGQLIVFETVSALAYAFVLRGHRPSSLTMLGVFLLVAGVIWATRIRPPSAKH